MTEEKAALLRELLAEKKRDERAMKKEAAFLAESDRRRDELLARWGLTVETSPDETDSTSDDEEEETVELDWRENVKKGS